MWQLERGQVRAAAGASSSMRDHVGVTRWAWSSEREDGVARTSGQDGVVLAA
jgi:hypothetical protein